jgi:hypothetical protein
MRRSQSTEKPQNDSTFNINLGVNKRSTDAPADIADERNIYGFNDHKDLTVMNPKNDYEFTVLSDRPIRALPRMTTSTCMLDRDLVRH